MTSLSSKLLLHPAPAYVLIYLLLSLYNFTVLLFCYLLYRIVLPLRTMPIFLGSSSSISTRPPSFHFISCHSLLCWYCVSYIFRTKTFLCQINIFILLQHFITSPLTCSNKRREKTVDAIYIYIYIYI